MTHTERTVFGRALRRARRYGLHGEFRDSFHRHLALGVAFQSAILYALVDWDLA